jgi:hypothetical protein
VTVSRSFRVWVASVVTVAGLAMLLFASRSGQTRDIAAHSTPYHPVAPVFKQPTAAQVTPPTGRPNTLPHTGSAPGWLGDLALALGIAAAVLLVGAITWYVVRAVRALDRGKDRTGPPPSDLEFAPPGVATALADAVDDVLAQIERGQPRDAIVACWMRWEDVAAEAGVARRPAETAADFTERVLSTYQVSNPTLVRLADLYREARFSAHRMDDTARGEARSALEQVRVELLAGRRNAEGTGADGTEEPAGSTVGGDGHGSRS